MASLGSELGRVMNGRNCPLNMTEIAHLVEILKRIHRNKLER